MDNGNPSFTSLYYRKTINVISIKSSGFSHSLVWENSAPVGFWFDPSSPLLASLLRVDYRKKIFRCLFNPTSNIKEKPIFSRFIFCKDGCKKFMKIPFAKVISRQISKKNWFAKKRSNEIFLKMPDVFSEEIILSHSIF